MSELSEYRAKRDFGTTPEPAGDAGAGGDAPRFVIQEHDATRIHWDLRLEHDGALASWALPRGIPLDPKQNHLAVHTEDHPLEYLEFHGTIPEGQYGAGRMTIWDRGTFELHKWRADEVIVTLHGERVEGRYALFRTRGEKDWMIHRMGPPADPAAEPLPEHVVPMLARAGELPAQDGRWGFEIKWDGVRAIAYSEPGRLRLESRNLNDITPRYPELRGLNRALGARTAVLDGEVVAFDAQGRPSFERLQHRMHLTGEAQVRRRARELPVVYVLFDLLYLDGHSLMELPYSERRARLEGLGLRAEHWQTPAWHDGDGGLLLEAARKQGLEGIVAKRVDSRYEPGRRGAAWLKVKVTCRQELVIAGWEPGEGRRRERIGALLMGYHDDAGDFVFAGKAGTGFSDAELRRLQDLLAPLERSDSPFDGRQPPRGAIFAEPRLVAEIEFTEWTADGMLRHPSYKGLRDDRAAAEVVLERPAAGPPPQPDAPPIEDVLDRGPRPDGDMEVTVEGRRLRLSNLGKLMYPQAGFTKADVIDYYRRIAPVLLPHLQGRPLTLKRYPNGVEGQYFYEKQCPQHRPDWVQTAPISSGRRASGVIDFCLAADLPTLVWTSNLADLELHTSLALAERIERPTMLVFDLDPGEPAGLLECCQVGLWLRGMFAGLGLECFAKTSGSKGLQAYVPLNSPVTYDETKPFARAVAETLEKGSPELVVSRMTKQLRRGKVLVDWSQNDEHKTTVNVYSLRARERPTVSTPVSWEEVEAAVKAGDASALVFEAHDVLERAERLGDIFAPVLALKQALPSVG